MFPHQTETIEKRIFLCSTDDHAGDNVRNPHFMFPEKRTSHNSSRCDASMKAQSVRDWVATGCHSMVAEN
jgi:hypothetical protein